MKLKSYNTNISYQVLINRERIRCSTSHCKKMAFSLLEVCHPRVVASHGASGVDCIRKFFLVLLCDRSLNASTSRCGLKNFLELLLLRGCIRVLLKKTKVAEEGLLVSLDRRLEYLLHLKRCEVIHCVQLINAWRAVIFGGTGGLW